MASIFVVVRSDGALIGSPFFNSRDAAVHGVRGDDRYRVVEYAPVEPWVLVSERLPEDGQEVEFFANDKRRFGQHVEWKGRRWFDEGDVRFTRAQVRCWRPARPLGELPEGKG